MIGITVVISAVTTFLSVRQSMKRGLMQNPTAAEDNPMAGAQKYMAYIAPLFALSGLYWQFGLVLYWMTSNIWQLGQQYFLFKKIPPLETAPAAATEPRRRCPARPPGPRPTSAPGRRPRRRAGAARPSAPRSPRLHGQAGRGRASPRLGRQSGSVGQSRRRGRRSSHLAVGQAARGHVGEAAGRGEAACRGQEACRGEDGGGRARHPAADPERERRHAAQAGPGTAEPEPEPEPPEVTFVRQQRAKQSRSKRSGKR